MRTHVWGPTGWQVPVLGQGTWYLRQADREEAIRALRRGLELGMTHTVSGARSSDRTDARAGGGGTTTLKTRLSSPA